MNLRKFFLALLFSLAITNQSQSITGRTILKEGLCTAPLLIAAVYALYELYPYQDPIDFDNPSDEERRAGIAAVFGMFVTIGMILEKPVQKYL